MNGINGWILAGVLMFPVLGFALPSQVKEQYQSEWDYSYNLDSLAVWHGKNGENWVLGTSKGKHLIQKFDAPSGKRIGSLGKKGNDLGSFNYPNGIAVKDDLLFVVERDNHRVQVLSLPSGKPMAEIGAAHLKRPYGINVIGGDHKDSYILFITDNYLDRNNATPPGERLGERVKSFAFSAGEKGHSQLLAQFGDQRGAGILKKVESIMADPKTGNLMVADEEAKNIKIYTKEGRFSGRTLGDGLFSGEPEGIALYDGLDLAGYWIFTDQSRDVSENQYHVFDRVTLNYIGSFRGFQTSNTDGICLTQVSMPGFEEGALFALHNDGGVSAFNWQKIKETLALRLNL